MQMQSIIVIVEYQFLKININVFFTSQFSILSSLQSQNEISKTIVKNSNLYLFMNNQFKTFVYSKNQATNPQITIHQPPELHPIFPPKFNIQASIPLNINFQICKQNFYNNSHHLKNQQAVHHDRFQILFPDKEPLMGRQINKSNNRIQNNFSSISYNLQSQKTIFQENTKLKRDIQQINKLYEQQKQKYNQLKNLYKEGQLIYAALQDRRIMLQRQNKQLKSILDNLWKLQNQNQENFNNNFNQSLEKDQYERKTYNQMHQKQQNQIYKKQYHQNRDQYQNIPKQRQFSFSKNGQKAKQGVINKIQKIKIGNKKIPVIKVNVPSQIFQKKDHIKSVSSVNSDQTGHDQHLFNLIEQLKMENQKLRQNNSDLMTQLNKTKINYQQTVKDTQSAYSTKINNLLNQIKSLQKQSIAKDQKIAILHNQCNLLQKDLNQTKYTSNMHRQTYNHNYSNSQIIPLQTNKPNQRNLLFQPHKLNYLNTKTPDSSALLAQKLKAELNQSRQKIAKQQFQLNRLYTILQNKNIELGQIYSAMKQSKRTLLQESSKKNFSDLEQTFGRKQMENQLFNSPKKQKLHF